MKHTGDKLLLCINIIKSLKMFMFTFFPDGMELETLYQRYCIRLKHALFLSCLTVASISCTMLLVTTCVLQTKVRFFKWQLK